VAWPGVSTLHNRVIVGVLAGCSHRGSLCLSVCLLLLACRECSVIAGPGALAGWAPPVGRA